MPKSGALTWAVTASVLIGCPRPSSPDAPTAAASAETASKGESPSTAPAAEPNDAGPCQPWTDEEGRLRLGRVPLGTPFGSLPGTLRRRSDCFVSKDRSTVDCELLDADGVAYLSDEVGVVRIEARLADLDQDVRLPLGLELGAPRPAVLDQLDTLPASSVRTELLQPSEFGASAPIASGFCVVHPPADPASFYLEFDEEGRLTAVGLRLNAG